MDVVIHKLGLSAPPFLFWGFLRISIVQGLYFCITWGTGMYYLFGGSAGREGIAVQMGASLSDQLAKFYRIEPEERKILLVSGAGAGFGAAIGTP